MTIYLDNNSTTKLATEVLQKMMSVYELPINASATHKYGQKGNQIIEEARQSLKNLLNAENYEVIFTGSSTEATNTILQGCGVEVILFSEIEHSSVYNCRPEGCRIIEISVLENGLVDLKDLQKKLENLHSKNFLVSIMLANNETGAIQPVLEIAKLVHQNGGLFHCDIVQAVGKIPVDLEKLNVDFASVSAHKFNGPQGVGALLMRKSLDIKPLIHGGKQEKSKRAGTSNVAGIAGFGEACKLAAKKVAEYNKLKTLRDFLEQEIQSFAGDDVKIFCTEIERLPNTSYIACKNRDYQTQLINFDLNGICVSAGAACSSGTLSESRILKAMKVEPNFSTSAIRVSLAPENNETEVQKFIKVWKEFYQKQG